MTYTLHITNKIIKLKIIFGKETAEKGTKNCKGLARYLYTSLINPNEQ